MSSATHDLGVTLTECDGSYCLNNIGTKEFDGEQKKMMRTE
jgi:hypothetical protein